jgi:AraC family transcriptional regulator, transcriptional activator of pobA
LYHSKNNEESFYHFNFLKDIKVYGVYYNSMEQYFRNYPFIRNEHVHDFYTILFLTGGKGTLNVNNISYNVGTGTICLIAPFQKHSFENLDNVQGLILFFCQDFYVEEFSYIRLLDVFSCTSQVHGKNCNPCFDLAEKEKGYFTELIRLIGSEYECCISSIHSVIIIRSLLNIMLLRLLEIYDAKSGRSNNGSSVLIHELSLLIDSSFIKEHNIGFYTMAFNISEKQLNVVCNSYFSYGLKKILMDRLMQEARKLLLSTDLSVSEISYKLNYDDNSYFNKIFKKETGLTPKKFRDIHKKLVP